MSETENNTPPRRRYLRWLVEAALIVAVLAILQAYQAQGVAKGLAPAFETRLLDGEPVSLQAYRGQPLLLHFWASWCPICRYEQGTIDSLARDHAVLTVAMEDMPVSEMQAWLAEQGVAYPVALDATGELANLYGVRGVPTSVVIDPSGEIRFVEVGYTTEIGLRARLWWAGR